MLNNDIKRITRLTAILTHLQAKRFVTAEKFAQKFGVSSRTVYRDIKTLESAGVPIFTEDGKGFSIMDTYRIPPIMFTEEEALALITADVIIQSSKDTSLITKFSEAIAKVKAVMPTTLSAKTETLAEKIGASTMYIDNSPKSKYLLEIQKAIVSSLVIAIDYKSKAGIASKRFVEPFAIFSNKDNEWLMVAFCQLRNEFRTFSLINIQKLEIANDHFIPYNMTFQKFLELSMEEYNAKLNAPPKS
jgi:predicted DNA-binding transcriptional regulator YafY